MINTHKLDIRRSSWFSCLLELKIAPVRRFPDETVASINDYMETHCHLVRRMVGRELATSSHLKDLSKVLASIFVRCIRLSPLKLKLPVTAGPRKDCTEKQNSFCSDSDFEKTQLVANEQSNPIDSDRFGL